jgi:hypothetical protein
MTPPPWHPAKVTASLKFLSTRRCSAAVPIRRRAGSLAECDCYTEGEHRSIHKRRAIPCAWRRHRVRSIRYASSERKSPRSVRRDKSVRIFRTVSRERTTNAMNKRHCEPAEAERAREAGECANYANCRNGIRLEGYASQRFLGERASSVGPKPMRDNMGDKLADVDSNRSDEPTILVEQSVNSWRMRPWFGIRKATISRRWWTHRATPR